MTIISSRLLSALALTAIVAAPARGFAQPDDDKPKDDAADKRDGSDGEEVDLADDLAAEDATPSATGDGSAETPGAPRMIGEEDPDHPKAPPRKHSGYPLEVVLRPLTLPKNTSELALELPVYFDPARASGSLRASYGINAQAQLSLRYAFGAIDEDGFTTGKAVALDFQYLITDWAAAQLAVPVYLDPFALGITVGVPLKFVFNDKLALEIGRDLVNIRVKRFFPSIEDPLYNEVQVFLDESGTLAEDGFLRFVGRASYQYRPKTTLHGEFGVVAPDFGLTDAGYVFRAAVTQAVSKRFDIGARIGFDNLDHAKETIGVTLNLAFRI